jgi:DNA-binding NtrC family response regulator
MEYVWSCDTVRLVAAPDRRDWQSRGTHAMDGLIKAAASADVPVLITAGKARARAIAGQVHRRSSLGDRDLVVLDCTLPPYRFEQDLFQCDALTPATILLLEVGQLPAGMQLRLRARMTVEAVARPADPVSARIGSRRLMASNSVSLFDSVLRGTFDRDLYYRLNTFQISGLVQA